MAVLIHAALPTQESWAKGAIRFDLDEVLDAIRPWAEPLTWSVYDLWALAGRGEVRVGSWSNDRHVELDNVTLDPACGDLSAPMSFPALVAFAACTHQVIDGLFVGSDQGADSVAVPSAEDRVVQYLRVENQWFRSYPIVVSAFDSTYWRIFVRDDAAAAALMKRLPLQTEELARW
jgi:hypothetical protein